MSHPTVRHLRHVAWFFVLAGVVRAEPPELRVDASRVTGDLDVNVWSSSGLTQDYLTPVFRQDMAQIGSVPYGGCRWVRPHDLLNLVSATGLGTDAPVYDWSKLDRTLDVVRSAGLTPIFEIMGNPSGFFTSFLDRGQLYAWKRLVRDLALHLESRYGAAEVRGWLFESWNEPDINFEWKWHDLDEHHHYYDACSEGLREADPRLRFGGPAVARRPAPHGSFLQGVLEHCRRGTNYFTGERGVRLDFISFHDKKKPQAMVDIEVADIDGILRDYPEYADKLILNDEADSEAGWSEKKFPYRATPWYAAFIARDVREQLDRVVEGGGIAGGRKINFRFSNDDAFWGPWIYRTQCAVFGTDERFALIKKPSHTVMTALALLGDRRCAVAEPAAGDGIGAIATRRGEDQVAILLYHYSDATAATGSAAVRLSVAGLPFASGRIAVYRIDSAHEDTYGAWQALGSPAVPTDDQIQLLRSKQELGVSEPVRELREKEFSQTIDLPLPGVCVIVISRDPGPDSAAAIAGLRAETYPSLSGARDDVMLRWDSGSRFVRTYEVLEAAAPEGPWVRVNPADQLDTGFVYEHAPGSGGYLKVRAIDYWGRVAGESAAVAVPGSP